MQQVIDLISLLVEDWTREKTRRSLRLENASRRPVFIEFASDPDVRITEKLETETRYILSIEVKGGGDASNIHNRLAEAEKSHLKAKKLGCAELWTITRVDVEPQVAKRASPSTTRFFHLDRIIKPHSSEHAAFREALASRVGIRTSS